MILVISPLKHYMFNLMLTGFVCFFRNKFPGLFQDFSRIQIDLSRALKFTLTRYTPKISMLILLTAFHALHNFLVEFNRFPELSRTSGFFPGLASPGKFHNKNSSTFQVFQDQYEPLLSGHRHLLRVSMV